MGINDILRGELQQQLVLQNIMKIAHHCNEHGVKEIVLSSVVATGRANADVLIHYTESMKNFSEANRTSFVNNDNIYNIYIKEIYT